MDLYICIPIESIASNQEETLILKHTTIVQFHQIQFDFGELQFLSIHLKFGGWLHVF